MVTTDHGTMKALERDEVRRKGLHKTLSSKQQALAMDHTKTKAAGMDRKNASSQQWVALHCR